MSFDMTQFYQVFFAEAEEHLASMEALLLELDVTDPDGEDLNAIFRAAHSIKGSAGTFGFNDMATLTHVLESLLDKIRKHELTLRTDMVDACLVARDILGNQLATHRDGTPNDATAAAELSARLAALATGVGPAAAPGAAPANAALAPSPAGTDALDARFVLAGEPEDWPELIVAVIQELAALGGASILHAATHPDEAWHLSIAGAADKADAVREVLEFVARSDSVRIGDASPAADDSFGFFDDEPVETAAEPSVALMAAADDGSFGFFDDEPQAADPEPAANDDDSFGLFVAESELPAVATAPVAVPATADRRGTERRTPVRAGGAESTIRVGVDKVDQIINQVGELIITQSMLIQAADSLDPILFERLFNGLMQLERNSRDLQESVMSIRMMPISTVFQRFPRVVRDLSQKLGKQVELKMSGENTELDRGLIERISDPLTHLIRNSLDHGIEMPDRRTAAGKAPVGIITLKAYQQSGNIVIEVGDDGAGLNRERILAKAAERGLPASAAMSDVEVWNLIFEPGFSTAEQVTDVSGRGVGMDVVKRNIAALGGRVDIESLNGIGTRMTVRLPLTLAILDGMSIGVGAETYIIPLGYVVESMQPTAPMIKRLGGAERVLQVRNEYLPVIVLHEAFGIRNATAQFERGIMVVLEVDGRRAALFVDALLGQHQVVIKSLEANYRRVNGIAGATIMGDGRVAFILDVVALVGSARASMPTAA